MEYYDQDELQCYSQYSRGPCLDNQMFVQPDGFDENGSIPSPVCVKNITDPFLRRMKDPNEKDLDYYYEAIDLRTMMNYDEDFPVVTVAAPDDKDGRKFSFQIHIHI